MRPVEEPKTVERPGPGGMSEEVTTHPAFAQIGASRVTGHTALYESDFTHNAYMTIRICRSELHRNLSCDWHFGKEKLIEVALSEAQWATFVSAPNVGSGVPCTLQWIAGQGPVPSLPAPAKRSEQFGKEMQRRIKDSVDELEQSIAQIDALGLPKGKAAAAKEALRRARSALGNSMVFIADQFDKHMENTVEKAKSEIHGYMTGALIRTGVAALTNGETPLQIDGPKPSADE